jgi:hypothetical protein
MMTVSCVYCRRTYAEKDGEGVSHGICDLCHNIVNEDFRQGGNCNPDDIRRIADFRLPACQRDGGM